jgi:hypothetical protein
MTGTATQSGQGTPQPAGESGAAAAAGDSTDTTLLGSTPQPGQQQQKPAGEAAQAKPNEGQKPAGEQKAGEEKPGEQKAPEKYADFEMPEGIELDAKLLEGATPILRELGLDQAKAQKLVSVLATHQAEQAQAFTEQLKDEAFAFTQARSMLQQHVDNWAKALKSDAEIGGKNFDANVQTAQRAIARFGSPALKDVLNKTGLGNNPEFVRFCLKVGHLVSEDSTALGSGGAPGSGQRKPTEQVLYGDSKTA